MPWRVVLLLHEDRAAACLIQEGGHVITGLLVDLDGVLRVWDRSIMANAEHQHGLAPGSLARAAFAHDLLLPAITGVTTDAEWRTAVVARLAEEYGGVASRAAVQTWSASPGAVNARVLHLVRQARQRVRVGLLTNATSRLDRDLAAIGLAGEFDVVVNSARVGIAKPAPQVFTAAMTLLGTCTSSTLFVDDTAANVATSAAMGIRSHRFTEVAKFEAWLRIHKMIE